jgi:predicted enzyme related to lactoylglutathione lyase
MTVRDDLALYAVLATRQMAAVVAFYKVLLEQPPHHYQAERYAEFLVQGMRLGIFTPKAEHADEFAPGKGGSLSLCLEVKQLERATAHLIELGYPPSGEIMTASHGREIYAYDPDGNRIILHERHL